MNANATDNQIWEEKERYYIDRISELENLVKKLGHTIDELEFEVRHLTYEALQAEAGPCYFDGIAGCIGHECYPK